MSEIADRLAAIRKRIGSARLIAVSKRHSVDSIRAAYAAGQRDFGENYVQELTSKAIALSDLPDVRWHMIGHLQRNKVRQVVGHASVVHTVDSPRLAEELGKRAPEVPPAQQYYAGNARILALVEVNVGGEEQKSGCAPPDLAAVLDAIESQPSLELAGLMTVPPHTEDPEGARPFFDELVKLRDAHGGRARLPELSMGMTHDLDQAIAAGATMVRIGTAIFGPRSSA